MKLIQLSKVENQSYFKITVETSNFWGKKLHTDYLVHLNSFYLTGLAFSHNLEKVSEDLARQIKLAIVEQGYTLK